MRLDNGRIGTTDNRGTPRNAQKSRLRPQIRLFYGPRPLVLFLFSPIATHLPIPNVSAVSKRLLLGRRAA